MECQATRSYTLFSGGTEHLIMQNLLWALAWLPQHKSMTYSGRHSFIALSSRVTIWLLHLLRPFTFVAIVFDSLDHTKLHFTWWNLLFTRLLLGIYSYFFNILTFKSTFWCKIQLKLVFLILNWMKWWCLGSYCFVLQAFYSCCPCIPLWKVSLSSISPS